jgi:hypothetical protein
MSGILKRLPEEVLDACARCKQPGTNDPLLTEDDLKKIAEEIPKELRGRQPFLLTVAEWEMALAFIHACTDTRASDTDVFVQAEDFNAVTLTCAAMKTDHVVGRKDYADSKIEQMLTSKQRLRPANGDVKLWLGPAVELDLEEEDASIIHSVDALEVKRDAKFGSMSLRPWSLTPSEVQNVALPVDQLFASFKLRDTTIVCGTVKGAFERLKQVCRDYGHVHGAAIYVDKLTEDGSDDKWISVSQVVRDEKARIARYVQKMTPDDLVDTIVAFSGSRSRRRKGRKAK